MSTLVDFPTSLPTAPIPQDTQAVDVATSFELDFSQLGPESFKNDAVWRDVFALTGTLRTFYGPSSISAAWNETSKRAQTSGFRLDSNSARISRLPTGNAWVEVLFYFETGAAPAASCAGLLSLVPGEDGKWQIWVMRSFLEQLKSQPSVDILEAVKPNATNGTTNDSTNDTNGHSKIHFDCVVIGGGQAGLSAGGRLKALGISYVILEKFENVGDNWMTRYGSARLHTTREYAHLPFERTFDPGYQEFLTREDLAKGYQYWVAKFDINIWTSTAMKSGVWDPTRNLWTLNIQKGDEESSITSSFVIVAAGGGGQIPRMPEFPGKEEFEGLVIHSKDYKNAKDWKGKHGVVIGTANTAHDVAEDMVEAGLTSVTMVQRGDTYVLPAEYYKRVADLVYNDKIPIEVADRAFLTSPFAIGDLTAQAGLHFMARKEPERFDALERAGFKLDRYGNITDCLYNRQGGHYMDVGASAKIADGMIKMKGDSPIVCYTKDGLEFADGSILKADVIVFATGFVGNMRYLVNDLFGEEVADQMGDFFGLDAEGELKGAFKPCKHPAIWYHGGTIGQARYMSRFIAFQIKAKLLGTPLPLYEKTP